MKTLVAAMFAIACTASAARSQDSTAYMNDAYLDEAAREMVRLARAHRSTVDRRIQRYETTARERFTVALTAGIADKLIYRRETATRIDWRRAGPVRFDVLGMREFAPVGDAKAMVPGDIGAELLTLAFDPSDADVLIRIDTTEITHPLNPGSERHYRFEAGDTTVIALPDGRSVRLRELRVIPRRRSPVLFTGSLWLAAESHAIVQAYIRPGRAIDADTDVSISVSRDTTDRGNVAATADSANPGSTLGSTLGRVLITQLMGLLKPMRLDVDFIAIDYGLWDLEWWLPRVMIARGVAQVGRFRIPITYERTYADYDVEGNVAIAAVARTDSVTDCRRTVRYVLPGDSLRVDSVRQARTDSAMARRYREDINNELQPCAREYVVSAPPDSVLLTSPDLPTSLYGDDFELVGEEDLGGIVARVRALENGPWRFGRAAFQWGLSGPGLFRYNRVEGPSLGARLVFDAGFAIVRPEVRYGFADQQLRGELMLERAGDALDVQLAGYRRLRSASMSSRAHSLTSSFGALLFGRDEEEYFDARGAELTLRPGATRTQWFTAQLYAERQAHVERNTRFSVASWFGDDSFDENMVADSAEQIGGRITLRAGIGRLGRGARLDGELTIGGETGEYTFTRNDLMVRLETPLAGRFGAAIEGALGTIEGDDVPVQALWRLDSSSMLRGYSRGAAVGERYWRTRTELSYDLSWSRISMFSDVAWAGPRSRFDGDGVFHSLGLGFSAFNGIARIDLARGMAAPGGWRLHVRLNPRL